MPGRQGIKVDRGFVQNWARNIAGGMMGSDDVNVLKAEEFRRRKSKAKLSRQEKRARKRTAKANRKKRGGR